MSYNLDGRKIYFNDDYDLLIKMINLNTLMTEKKNEDNNTNKYDRYISRNNKIINKLKTYKKTDKDNNIFLYLFPNELEDIMWILFENNITNPLINIAE